MCCNDLHNYHYTKKGIFHGFKETFLTFSHLYPIGNLLVCLVRLFTNSKCSVKLKSHAFSHEIKFRQFTYVRLPLSCSSKIATCYCQYRFLLLVVRRFTLFLVITKQMSLRRNVLTKRQLSEKNLRWQVYMPLTYS